PGCTVVMAAAVRDAWDRVHHPSYPDIWERALTQTRDPYEISARFEEEFARHAGHIDAYRHRFAFHPIHGILATHPLRRLRRAGEVVEIRPRHLAAAAFQILDQRDEPFGQRHREAVGPGRGHRGAEQRADLGFALADGEIPPDAGLRLGGDAVVAGDTGHGPLAGGRVAAGGRPVVGRIVLVERFQPDAGALG